MFLPTFVISKCCLDFNHIFPKCRDFTREFCCIKQLNPCPLHVCQFVFQLLSPQMFAPFLSCFVVIGSQPWNIWNMGFVGKSETIFCFQRWLGNFQISYDLAPVSQSVSHFRRSLSANANFENVETISPHLRSFKCWGSFPSLLL